MRMSRRLIFRLMALPAIGALLHAFGPELPCDGDFGDSWTPTPDSGTYYVVSTTEGYTVYPSQDHEGETVAEIFFHAGTSNMRHFVFCDILYIGSGFTVWEPRQNKWLQVSPLQADRWWPLMMAYAVRVGMISPDLAPHIEPNTSVRHIRWPGAAGNAVLAWLSVLLLFESVWRSYRFVVRLQRRRSGYCILCGYDLRGEFSSGCPECGWRREESGAERVSG